MNRRLLLNLGLGSFLARGSTVANTGTSLPSNEPELKAELRARHAALKERFLSLSPRLREWKGDPTLSVLEDPHGYMYSLNQGEGKHARTCQAGDLHFSCAYKFDTGQLVGVGASSYLSSLWAKRKKAPPPKLTTMEAISKGRELLTEFIQDDFKGFSLAQCFYGTAAGWQVHWERRCHSIPFDNTYFFAQNQMEVHFDEEFGLIAVNRAADHDDPTETKPTKSADEAVTAALAAVSAAKRERVFRTRFGSSYEAAAVSETRLVIVPVRYEEGVFIRETTLAYRVSISMQIPGADLAKFPPVGLRTYVNAQSGSIIHNMY